MSLTRQELAFLFACMEVADPDGENAERVYDVSWSDVRHKLANICQTSLGEIDLEERKRELARREKEGGNR